PGCGLRARLPAAAVEPARADEPRLRRPRRVRPARLRVRPGISRRHWAPALELSRGPRHGVGPRQGDIMAKKSIWLPVSPPPPLRSPNAVKAGPWVFVSGTMGGPVGGGLAPEVRGNPALPLAGEAKGIREARSIFATIEAALKEAGTSVNHGVWLNQFVTAREHVDPYHEVRRDFIRPPRPASTTGAPPELLAPDPTAPDATVQVDMVAIEPGLAPAKEGITVDTTPQPLAGAGYSPAVRVGDYVFVAGQMATDFRTGIPAEAQITGVFWEGSSIRRQTEFILKNLKLTLEAAGSSMAHVLKAQIWLANIGDLPRMEDAWRTAFPQEPPARTVL